MKTWNAKLREYVDPMTNVEKCTARFIGSSDPHFLTHLKLQKEGFAIGEIEAGHEAAIKEMEMVRFNRAAYGDPAYGNHPPSERAK